jgi:hypothetical protein
VLILQETADKTGNCPPLGVGVLVMDHVLPFHASAKVNSVPDLL